MKKEFLLLALFASTLASAQQPKELEFETLPCTAPGAITSDGRTCTKKDVDKYVKSEEKLMTNEEKNFEKLSKKKDPLKQRRVIDKKSRGTMMSGSNYQFGGN